jgi:hypothetical protein
MLADWIPDLGRLCLLIRSSRGTTSRGVRDGRVARIVLVGFVLVGLVAPGLRPLPAFTLPTLPSLNLGSAGANVPRALGSVMTVQVASKAGDRKSGSLARQVVKNGGRAGHSGTSSRPRQGRCIPPALSAGGMEVVLFGGLMVQKVPTTTSWSTPGSLTTAYGSTDWSASNSPLSVRALDCELGQ